MESKAFGTVRPRERRSCCSLGRGGSAGGRRVGYRYHILDPSASWGVALAGRTHHRGGRPPPRPAGTWRPRQRAGPGRPPGVPTNAVRAPRPDWRELDDEVLRRTRVYVDSREAAMKESGDIIAAGKIFAEVGEVVAETKPGRQSSEEVTLFKSLGLAVEDVATAEFIYRKALDEEASSTHSRS